MPGSGFAQGLAQVLPQQDAQRRQDTMFAFITNERKARRDEAQYYMESLAQNVPEYENLAKGYDDFATPLMERAAVLAQSGKMFTDPKIMAEAAKIKSQLKNNEWTQKAMQLNRVRETLKETAGKLPIGEIIRMTKKIDEFGAKGYYTNDQGLQVNTIPEFDAISFDDITAKVGKLAMSSATDNLKNLPEFGLTQYTKSMNEAKFKEDVKALILADENYSAVLSRVDPMVLDSYAPGGTQLEKAVEYFTAIGKSQIPTAATYQRDETLSTDTQLQIQRESNANDIEKQKLINARQHGITNQFKAILDAQKTAFATDQLLEKQRQEYEIQSKYPISNYGAAGSSIFTELQGMRLDLTAHSGKLAYFNPAERVYMNSNPILDPNAGAQYYAPFLTMTQGDLELAIMNQDPKLMETQYDKVKSVDEDFADELNSDLKRNRWKSQGNAKSIIEKMVAKGTIVRIAETGMLKIPGYIKGTDFDNGLTPEQRLNKISVYEQARANAAKTALLNKQALEAAEVMKADMEANNPTFTNQTPGRVVQ